jgi:hypothetical protein
LLIDGRVELQTAAATTPIAGATVAITKLWRQIPSPVLNPPPDPFQPLSLDPALAASRPIATTLRRRSAIVAPSTFVLLDDLQPGLTTFRLSNTVGLAPGQILAFDRLDLDHREFVAIDSITGAISPLQPATIQLRFALAYRHFKVESVTLGPAGAVNTLGVPAIEGDRVFLADSLNGIVTGTLIEISGGAAPDEYRTGSIFSVTSDVRGFYRLPPLSRVGQLELTAQDGVHLPFPRMLIPKYEEGHSSADFTLR